jgi:hypothetical protein
MEDEGKWQEISAFGGSPVLVTLSQEETTSRELVSLTGILFSVYG